MIEIMSQEEYKNLLDKTQSYVTEHYSAEVAALHGQRECEKRMKEIIKRSLLNMQVFTPYDENLKRSVSLLYEDMAGMSFLAKYLRDIDKYPDLEEININAWNSITLVFSGGRTKFSKETFLSPKHAEDIIKNIISQHNDVLDNSVPGVVSYISNNIRITALKYPLIPKETGIVASIRITRPGSINKTMLVETGSVSQEIIDFLLTCIKYSVSMCIGGKMGSGKTTMLNYLLSKLSNDKRIYLIEEGSRECDLSRHNKNGKMTNQVISTLARPSKADGQNFDASKLLELGLRFDADYFVPQEMRSGEAYVATESARTGSTVLTTIHSNDAESTFTRMMTLMQKASEQKESTLMMLAVEAFPLVVYMAKLKDGTRRVMEVLEAERYSHEDGLITRPLYNFCVDDNIENSDGTVTVNGHFEKVNGISKRLQGILKNNGAPKNVVLHYAESAGKEE